MKNKAKEICERTYAEAYEDFYSLGTALADMGISKKHVACIGENSYMWINTYLTTLLSDSVFVGIDKELPESDYLHVMTDSDASVIFYQGKFEESLKANREALSNVKYFVGFDREEDEGEFLSYNKLIEKGKALYEAGNRDYVNLTSDEYDLKMLVYTLPDFLIEARIYF